MPGLDPGIHRNKAAGESPPLSLYWFVFSRRKSHRFSCAVQMAKKLRRLKIIYQLADALER
jgi:hypothetical protein